MPRAFLLLALLLLPACDAKAPDAGERIGGADPAELRITALSPAIGVMLRDLGLEGRIVARHNYDRALDPAIPPVGDQLTIDYERLIALDPTHVYTQFEGAGVPARLRTIAADRGWALEDLRLTSLDEIAVAMDDLHLDLRGFDTRRAEEFDPTRQFERTTLPSERLAHAWRDRGPAVRGAGRVLMLAATDPPGVLGPGSFHDQLLTRIGGTPAVTTGGPWQELDAEDLLRLAPDTIVVFIPESREHPDDLFTEPPPPAWGEAEQRLGRIATLPIPAVEHRRVVLIFDELALLPSSSLAGIADHLADALAAFSNEPHPPTRSEPRP